VAERKGPRSRKEKVAARETDTELKHFTGKNVVLDTSTPIVYIGRLESVSEKFIGLKNVDVHDTSGGGSTKEVYCIDARKYGIKKNRNFALVSRNAVISVSLLEDVVEY
jgi:hypothetical protein